MLTNSARRVLVSIVGLLSLLLTSFAIAPAFEARTALVSFPQVHAVGAAQNDMYDGASNADPGHHHKAAGDERARPKDQHLDRTHVITGWVTANTPYGYDALANSAQQTHRSEKPENAAGPLLLRQNVADEAKPFSVPLKFDAAKSVPAQKGIVYGRTDLAGGKPYIGQAMSEGRFAARQAEHARANPDADFEYEILGRADPGTALDRMEEFFIRQGGGPTNKGNPGGGLANQRHQMNDSRYADAGGDLLWR